MNKTKFIIISFLLVSLIIGGFYSVRADSQAQLIRVEGSVYYRQGSWWIFSSSWEEVTGVVSLREGAEIRTYGDSQAELFFGQQGRMLIDSHSKLELVEDKTGELTARKVKLNWGEVMVRFIDELRPEESFEIETPSAVAGIRGTTFRVAVDETGVTEIGVREGEVEVSNQRERIQVHPGTRVQVRSQTAALERKPEVKEEKWQEKQNWLERGREWAQEVKAGNQPDIGPPESAGEHPGQGHGSPDEHPGQGHEDEDKEVGPPDEHPGEGGDASGSSSSDEAPGQQNNDSSNQGQGNSSNGDSSGNQGKGNSGK